MQYQDKSQDQKSKVQSPVRDPGIEHALSALQSQIKEQNDTIMALQRDLKRLKNELRVAVNHFNLKHGG